MERTRLIVVLVLSLLGGMIIGAACTAGLGALFMRSAEDTRLIADATTYVSILEQIRAKNLDGADNVLGSLLRAAMTGLQVDEDRLPEKQREQWKAIQNRLSALPRRSVTATANQ